MQKTVKYTIFNTRWGYFGLVVTQNAVLRTHLPDGDPEKLKSLLLKNLPKTEFQKSLLKSLQQQIIRYFDGQAVNFDPDLSLNLESFTLFERKVLTVCRTVMFSQKISYTQLAKKAGTPKAVRAVANTLAKNPLPLIIPCHRIIRSDGQIGGFSAPGGKNLKKKLLKHEGLVTDSF